MDIDKLNSFLVLAKKGNFARASELLYISQPALSKRIQALEEELQVPLFNRIGSRSYLTTEGRNFLQYAQQIVSTYNLAIEDMHQIKGLETGTLSFGATNFIGVYIMPRFISHFHRTYPKIRINMIINDSRTILDMLHKNQLEFAVISDYILRDKASRDQYISRSFLEDRLALVVGSAHPLFGRDHCSLREVEEDLYISKTKHSSQNQFLEELFREHAFYFKNRMVIGNQEAVKECVINNIGISILSTRSVAQEVLNRRLATLKLDEFEIKREIQYTCLKGRHLTPAAKAFLDTLPPPGPPLRGQPADQISERTIEANVTR